jgi:TonB family protein
MQKLGLIALLVALGAGCVCGQQTGTYLPPWARSTQPERVKVYAVGPGVTAPELLPLDPPPISPEKCKEKIDGKVELSVLVDTAGRARNIMFLRPLGNDADKFAVQIAGADQFKPGTVNGKPVVVAESLNVKIQSCVVESQDGEGKKGYFLRLRSAPVQELVAPSDVSKDATLTSGENTLTDSNSASPHLGHVVGTTKAPVPLTQPKATYTDEAWRARITGTCLVSLIVDRQGMPQNPRITESLDPGLDQNALYAASRYRFKPAMRDGEPVPVMVNVKVIFESR